jgi:c-di-GMP-related signal transduction protein
LTRAVHPPLLPLGLTSAATALCCSSEPKAERLLPLLEEAVPALRGKVSRTGDTLEVVSSLAQEHHAAILAFKAKHELVSKHSRDGGHIGGA